MEAALERANLVVQRVETENDVGRDAFVEIVEGNDVTGGVISLQVKSQRSCFHQGRWVLPGKPADFTLWRESTVPVFGIVHDEASGALRWVDLSEAARMDDPYLGSIVPGPFGRRAVAVPDDHRLDLDVDLFLTAARTSLRRVQGLPTAALLARDPETVRIGIADTFAIGRHDANAFLLLGALYHRLPGDCRLHALIALGMPTRNPDIAWSQRNWIPEAIKGAVHDRTRWTPADVDALLAMIDEDGIERGTIGQTVFHVLHLDRYVDDRLYEAAITTGRPERARLWAAVILLYDAGDDAPAILARLLRLAPDLMGVDGFEFLVATVGEFGYVSLF